MSEDLLAAVRALVLKPDASAEELGDAAAALFEVRDASAVIEVLLPLLQHEAIPVRLGAIGGLSTHPYPVVLAALAEVYQHDASELVGAAASRVLEDVYEQPLACLYCGTEGAKLAPPPSADPHADLPRPMFCDEHCLTAWALAEARESHHLCVTAACWTLGYEDDCKTCRAAALVGLPPRPPPRTRG